MSGEAARAGNYEIAAAVLGLLTATYHDGDHFGQVTVEQPSAIGNDTGKVVRLATGMTALARLLIGIRHQETGASPDETRARLRPQVQEKIADKN